MTPSTHQTMNQGMLAKGNETVLDFKLLLLLDDISDPIHDLGG